MKNNTNLPFYPIASEHFSNGFEDETRSRSHTILATTKKQRGLELYKAQHNTPVQLRVLLFFLRDWRLKLFYAVSLSLSIHLFLFFSFLFWQMKHSTYERIWAHCALSSGAGNAHAGYPSQAPTPSILPPADIARLRGRYFSHPFNYVPYNYDFLDSSVCKRKQVPLKSSQIGALFFFLFSGVHITLLQLALGSEWQQTTEAKKQPR